MMTPLVQVLFFLFGFFAFSNSAEPAVREAPSALLSTFVPVKEYCDRQYFEAACPANEVIVIHSAVYGRMKVGRCDVSPEYGSVGCQAHVITVLDSLCSGRQQCSFHASALHDFKPCPKELAAYLEASYHCVKVISCDVGETCEAGAGAVRVTSPSLGYLTNTMTSRPGGGCGSASCPWLLIPQPGQRFNITFYTFPQPSVAGTAGLSSPSSHASEHANQQPLLVGSGTGFAAGAAKTRFCQRLATMIDKTSRVSKDVTVCNEKDPRTTNYVTSESSAIEIRMYEMITGDRPTYFLVKYEAIGCLELTAPPGAWSKRDGDDLVFGCYEIVTTWRLTCDGHTWLGDMRDCDQDQHNGVIKEASNMATALQEASTTTQGLVLVVGMGVILGVIFGFAMLGVAVMVIKRQRRLAAATRRDPRLSHYGKPDDDLMNSNNFYDRSDVTYSEKTLHNTGGNSGLYYRTYQTAHDPAAMTFQTCIPASMDSGMSVGHTLRTTRVEQMTCMTSPPLMSDGLSPPPPPMTQILLEPY